MENNNINGISVSNEENTAGVHFCDDPEELALQARLDTQREEAWARLRINETMEAAHEARMKGDTDEELRIVAELVDRIISPEEFAPFEDTEDTVFYSYENTFEHVLLDNRYPDVKIVEAVIPYSRILRKYGRLLFEHERYMEAAAALEQAVLCNPVSGETYLLLASVNRAMEDWENMHYTAVCALKTATASEALAAAYRCLGFEYAAAEKWRECISCIAISAQFDHTSAAALSEIRILHAKSKNQLSIITRDDVEALFEELDIPFGPAADIVGIAYSLGTAYKELGEPEGARWCLDVVNSLCGDDYLELRKHLDELEAMEAEAAKKEADAESAGQAS